jgi:hypothetical protein
MFHHQIGENTGTSAASADWRGIGKRSAKDRQPNVALCGFSFVDFPLRIFLCVFSLAIFLADFPWWRLPSFRNKQA